MKKITFILALVFYTLLSAQPADSPEVTKQIFIKVNALFLPVGVLNAGLEYQVSKKMTFQGDVFISPWKSFMGNHAQFYIGMLETRYYFKESFQKWYVGANIGGTVFDVQKWNYINSNLFQRGFAFLAGATLGYQMNINDKWKLDFYIGGGTSQGFYHGYDEADPENIVIYYDETRKWNRSGELLPYRGGLMISYKLK